MSQHLKILTGNQNSETFTIDKKLKESQKCHHSGSKQDHQKPHKTDECGSFLWSHLSVLDSSWLIDTKNHNDSYTNMWLWCENDQFPCLTIEQKIIPFYSNSQRSKLVLEHAKKYGLNVSKLFFSSVFFPCWKMLLNCHINFTYLDSNHDFLTSNSKSHKCPLKVAIHQHN